MDNGTATLNELKEDIQSFNQRHKDILKNSKQSNIYKTMFVFMGALQRSLWNCKGFLHNIDNDYFLSAYVLRSQMDTLMRLYAIGLYKDPELMADHLVLKRDKYFKDFYIYRDGKKYKFTDSFLKRELTKHYDWFSKVYENLCGMVHFSDIHSRVMWDMKDLEKGVLEINLSDDDSPSMNFKARIELAECMKDTTDILLMYIEDYFVKASKT